MDQYIRVIDPNQVFKIPIKRMPFVKRVNNLKFQQGTLVSNELSNPSTAEGFVDIPISLAKSIIGIPAEIFRIQIGNSAKELEYLQSQSSLEDEKSRLELSKLQRENEYLKAEIKVGRR